MDSFTTLRLLFLGVLLVAVIASVAPFLFRRGSAALQQVGIWVVIFGAVTFAFAALDQPINDYRSASRVTATEGTIIIDRARDGHYYLTATLNGAPVDFVVDTGATGIVLTQDAANAAGLNADKLVYSGVAMTANGETRVAPARVAEFTIGEIADTNIRVMVNEGEMDQSLLGMSYLQMFESISISGQQMTLTR